LKSTLWYFRFEHIEIKGQRHWPNACTYRERV
jgi:hypothetical protein